MSSARLPTIPITQIANYTLTSAKWLFHPSTWSTADYCHLQDLYVAEDVRRGDVGRALIEHVYAEGA